MVERVFAVEGILGRWLRNGDGMVWSKENHWILLSARETLGAWSKGVALGCVLRMQVVGRDQMAVGSGCKWLAQSAEPTESAWGECVFVPTFPELVVKGVKGMTMVTKRNDIWVWTENFGQVKVDRELISESAREALVPFKEVLLDLTFEDDERPNRQSCYATNFILREKFASPNDFPTVSKVAGLQLLWSMSSWACFRFGDGDPRKGCGDIFMSLCDYREDINGQLKEHLPQNKSFAALIVPNPHGSFKFRAIYLEPSEDGATTLAEKPLSFVKQSAKDVRGLSSLVKGHLFATPRSLIGTSLPAPANVPIIRPADIVPLNGSLRGDLSRLNLDSPGAAFDSWEEDSNTTVSSKHLGDHQGTLTQLGKASADFERNFYRKRCHSVGTRLMAAGRRYAEERADWVHHTQGDPWSELESRIQTVSRMGSSPLAAPLVPSPSLPLLCSQASLMA